jgi:hypothetical protein
MIFFARKPWSAVTTKRDLQSTTRFFSDLALKPANTTECGAPMRAQASITNASSGIMGMYTVTASPFLMPASLKALAILHTSRKTSLYVKVLDSVGSLPSQIMAGWSPRVGMCRSRQFVVTFIWPLINQATSPCSKPPVLTLSKGTFQVKCFCAMSPQNLEGSLTLSFHNFLY